MSVCREEIRTKRKRGDFTRQEMVETLNLIKSHGDLKSSGLKRTLNDINKHGVGRPINKQDIGHLSPPELRAKVQRQLRNSGPLLFLAKMLPKSKN